MTDTSMTAFTAIALMAAVTYLTRVSGFLIASRISALPPGVQRFLDYLPGTIIISIIAPQIVSGGWLTWSAALLCLGLALATRNLVAVMAAGVVYVSVIRWIL